MRIGEVARACGLPSTTIRYYEDIGLMPAPVRSANGYRDYGPEDVERLHFVRDAQESGFALVEIASILELVSQGQPTCHHVIELIERHLEDIDRRIVSLRASRRQYATLMARARTLDPTDCTNPDRCLAITALPAHRAQTH